jgi:hypothetical protein
MRVSAFAFCALMAGQSYAQLVDLDPDWKEQVVAPPATYRVDRLVPIEMPRYVTMKMGLDPDSLTISKDGIVRYVVVATSESGSRTAMFEGIWCRTGEVKVYARFGSDGKWNAVQDAEWRPLSGNQRSMHALALARQGVCNGRSAAAANPAMIIRKLSQPAHAGVQR